jgi:hypothetical protein
MRALVAVVHACCGAAFVGAQSCPQAWEVVTPPDSATTGCGAGADFQFYFRSGTSNRLVIEFAGGGGCWDEFTCALPLWRQAPEGPVQSAGLTDRENPDNPIRSWNYLYIPCVRTSPLSHTLCTSWLATLRRQHLSSARTSSSSVA